MYYILYLHIIEYYFYKETRRENNSYGRKNHSEILLKF